MRRERIGMLLTFGTALAYGLWPSAVRGVYAERGNAVFVILLSSLFRTLPLLAACAWQRQPLFRTRRDIRNGLTGGFFQAISTSASLGAVFFLPGPLAVVIVFSHTLMLLFFMIWKGEIKPDIATLAATVSALGGLCLVLDLFHAQSQASLTGMAIAFIGAVAVASRLYVYGHQTRTRPPAVVGAENFLVSLALLPLLLLYQTPVMPATAAGWAWMALGCVSLGVGTLTQFYAIGLLGSFRYSLFLKLEPMFATIFAAVLIGEYLELSQYIGIVLVIGSLAVYQIFDHRRRHAMDNVIQAAND